MKQKYVLALIGGIFLASLSVGFFATLASSPPAEDKTVYDISLLDGKAVPDTIIVKVGEYVQLNAKDGKDHDIGYGKGDAFGHEHDHPASDFGESGRFGPGEGYRLEFTKTGIYYFHDHLDPRIEVTVIAYDPHAQ